MPYTPQTWQNIPITTTPIDATRLNYMEAGILAASQIEFRNSAGYLQYRVGGTSGTWTNLLDLASITPVVDYSGLGILRSIRYNGSSWPARTVPAGYTDIVEWDSLGYANAPAPSGALTGDRWLRRVPTA